MGSNVGVRAGAFALALALVATADFSAVAVAGFAFVAAIAYLLPLFRTFSHPTSFALLALLAAVLGSQLTGAAQHAPFIVAVGILAYLILALKELHIVERAPWRYVATFGVWYLIALAFFAADHSRVFTLHLVLAAGGSFLLWREFFRASLPAGIAALVTGESLWVIATLPLTMINSANLAALVLFTATDLLRRSPEGIPVRSVLIHLTIAVSITIAIFLIAAFL